MYTECCQVDRDEKICWHLVDENRLIAGDCDFCRLTYEHDGTEDGRIRYTFVCSLLLLAFDEEGITGS